jgi:hypothetical protein
VAFAGHWAQENVQFDQAGRHGFRQVEHDAALLVNLYGNR